MNTQTLVDVVNKWASEQSSAIDGITISIKIKVIVSSPESVKSYPGEAYDLLFTNLLEIATQARLRDHPNWSWSPNRLIGRLTGTICRDMFETSYRTASNKFDSLTVAEFLEKYPTEGTLQVIPNMGRGTTRLIQEGLLEALKYKW